MAICGAARGGPRTSARAWAGLAVVLAGAFLAMLDTFVVNVAVPAISADLHAGESDTELVIAGYTLIYAAGMILGGRLGDTYGHRRVFMIGVSAFTLASGVCGAAPSVGVLIAGRLVQGAAAALLSPQVLAIIRVTFSAAGARTRAFAWYGVAVGLASVTGQVVGGAVVGADWWGLAWRPVFLINLPIGAVTVIAVPWLVRGARAERRVRLDVGGAMLSTLGLGLLLTGFIAAPRTGWTGWPAAMLAAAVCVLTVFFADQSRKTTYGRSPLLDTRLFRDRSFAIGTAAILLFSATMPSLYLGFTVLLQDGRHVSALAAGLDFAPLALAFTLASFLAGRTVRAGPRRTVALGAALTAIGGAVATAVCSNPATGIPGPLTLALVTIGAGTGLFMTPVFSIVLATVSARQAGVAAGVLSAMQRLGNSLGVAVLTIPFLATYHRLRSAGTAAAPAYTAAFAALAAAVTVTCCAVFVLALLLPADRSHATGPQRRGRSHQP